MLAVSPTCSTATQSPGLIPCWSVTIVILEPSGFSTVYDIPARLPSAALAPGLRQPARRVARVTAFAARERNQADQRHAGEDEDGQLERQPARIRVDTNGSVDVMPRRRRALQHLPQAIVADERDAI